MKAAAEAKLLSQEEYDRRKAAESAQEQRSQPAIPSLAERLARFKESLTEPESANLYGEVLIWAADVEARLQEVEHADALRYGRHTPGHPL